MAIRLNLSPGAFACDESEKPLPEADPATMVDQLRDALAFQEQCKAEAAEFLQFYFTPDGSIHTSEMAEWLEKKGALDRWFFVHLIEIAGQKFVEQAHSAHKAEIARAKNAAARAWVLEHWLGRADKKQSKASFGRQFAHLVKINFDASVAPETIYRDWLKGQ